jgi:hypothetical protein
VCVNEGEDCAGRGTAPCSPIHHPTHPFHPSPLPLSLFPTPEQAGLHDLDGPGGHGVDGVRAEDVGQVGGRAPGRVGWGVRVGRAGRGRRGRGGRRRGGAPRLFPRSQAQADAERGARSTQGQAGRAQQGAGGAGQHEVYWRSGGADGGKKKEGLKVCGASVDAAGRPEAQKSRRKNRKKKISTGPCLHDRGSPFRLHTRSKSPSPCQPWRPPRPRTRLRR